MSTAQGDTATLTAEYTDGSGSFTDPTTPLVSVLNPLGDVIVANAVPTRTSLGHYSYDFAVPSDATLGTWIARWTGTLGGTPQTADDEFDVVAGPGSTSYVSLDELRALPDISDSSAFTDGELQAARTWFETRFEDYTGVAWVPRTATTRLDGTGTPVLLLPRYPILSVQSVRVFAQFGDFTDFSTDDLADLQFDRETDGEENAGELRRFSLCRFPFGYSNILVTYTHGHTTPPADIVDAAKVAIRQKLLDDKTGGRANRQFSVATEAGIARSSLPGLNTPFGIPAVDAVANYRRKSRAPVIA